MEDVIMECEEGCSVMTQEDLAPFCEKMHKKERKRNIL
jgi:hypothetical protein